jgi:hypothetical protein
LGKKSGVIVIHQVEKRSRLSPSKVRKGGFEDACLKSTFVWRSSGRRLNNLQKSLNETAKRALDERSAWYDGDRLSASLHSRRVSEEARLILGDRQNDASGRRSSGNYDVNDDLSGLQRKYPRRFVGLAQTPILDGKAALDELRRAITDLGLRGVTITSTGKRPFPRLSETLHFL